jgi:uncharacterized iron-regulated membrane protein
MWLRRWHRVIGLVFAPFFLITAVTGAILLFRRHFGPAAKHEMLQWHNWEGLADYVGVILAIALAWMAVTGWALWLQIYLRKRKARKK